MMLPKGLAAPGGGGRAFCWWIANRDCYGNKRLELAGGSGPARLSRVH